MEDWEEDEVCEARRVLRVSSWGMGRSHGRLQTIIIIMTTAPAESSSAGKGVQVWEGRKLPPRVGLDQKALGISMPSNIETQTGI